MLTLDPTPSGCVGDADGRCGLPRAFHPDDLARGSPGPGTLGYTLPAADSPGQDAGTRSVWPRLPGPVAAGTRAWHPLLHYPLSIIFQPAADSTGHEDALDRVLQPGRLCCRPTDPYPYDAGPLQPADLHCLLPPSITASSRSDHPCPTLRALPRHNLALAL